MLPERSVTASADPIIGYRPPNWLGPLAAYAGVAAVLLLVASAVACTRRLLLAVALVTGSAAVLVIPATGSALLASDKQGFTNTPFESKQTTALYETLLGLSSAKESARILPIFEKLQGGAPYVMAVYTSAVASEFITASGKEFLPIGGFTGSIPEPTIGQLEGMIRANEFHLCF